MSKNNPISRMDNIVTQESSNELLIYDLKTNKACCLNETSSIVWNNCDGKNSISDIKNKLSEKLKTEASEDMVLLALEELRKNNLLAEESAAVSYLNGMSRRQLIRQTALASLIALPLISSVVAPPAAHAQTGQCGPNNPCDATDPAVQCCSGVCVNTANNTQNCGACGVVCAPGTSCVVGQCQ